MLGAERSGAAGPVSPRGQGPINGVIRPRMVRHKRLVHGRRGVGQRVFRGVRLRRNRDSVDPAVAPTARCSHDAVRASNALWHHLPRDDAPVILRPLLGPLPGSCCRFTARLRVRRGGSGVRRQDSPRCRGSLRPELRHGGFSRTTTRATNSGLRVLLFAAERKARRRLLQAVPSDRAPDRVEAFFVGRPADSRAGADGLFNGDNNQRTARDPTRGP